MCTYSTHNICVENYAELYNYTFKILVKKIISTTHFEKYPAKAEKSF